MESISVRIETEVQERIYYDRSGQGLAGYSQEMYYIITKHTSKFTSVPGLVAGSLLYVS